MADVTLQIRKNGGSVQTGAVSAAVGDTIQLTAATKVGWHLSQTRWEIWSFPPEFTVPAGWSTAADGSFYVLGSADPPVFTCTHWGRYLTRVTAAGQTDERTVVDIQSPRGLRDNMRREGSQFGGQRLQSADAFQRNARVIDNALPFPAAAVRIPPSGGTTGVVDNAKLAAAALAGVLIVMDGAGLYWDNGAPIVWNPATRVVTTDGRPAIWQKGSAATSDMNAIPGCLNTSSASIDMNLPPAVNWKDQIITCEAQGPFTVDVDPTPGETIGTASTLQLGGTLDRVTISSRGTSKLIPIDGGQPDKRSVYANAVLATETHLTLRAAQSASAPGEGGNIELKMWRLRGPTFTSGSAIVWQDAVDNTNLLDIQTFGNTSANNYIYIRWGYFTGERKQMLAPNESSIRTSLAAGADLVDELGLTTCSWYVVAAAATGPVRNFEATGVGAANIRSVAGQAVTVLVGTTERIKLNATGIGFNGSAPVAKATISGSRTTDLANIVRDTLAFLNSRGDIVDATTP